MNDRMRWLYEHYIRQQLERRPRDPEDAWYFDLLYNGLRPDQHRELEGVTAFCAAEGFRLGLKMGLALGEELR